MLLLSSDYDKTLNTFKYDLKFNLVYLKKFIGSGNLFLLNTGREYKSIKREIDKYQIPFNYLSCNDGNILFDQELNVMYNSKLSNSLFWELESLKRGFELIIKPIKFEEDILEFELIIFNLNKRFLLELDKIMLKYNLCYHIFKKNGYYYVYIYSNVISKKTPIEYLKKKHDIEYENIYTIGDHYNDLEMIRDYNGYAMKWAKKRVKEQAIDTCLSVSSLIKQINRRR